MDKNKLRETILSKITLPSIPERTVRADAFGILPDSTEIQTLLIQNAIDSLSEAGGGRLVFSSGRYRTGALQIKNHVELHLESEDTVLSFVNEEPEKHYPLVFTHWEASPCYNFSPLVYAYEAHDIAVTGKGTLDGGADAQHWWNWHHQVEAAWSSNDVDMQLADRNLLRNMNQNGVPVEERIFGQGHYLRPNFVQFIKCSRVLLKDFTLINSPMWQLNPVMCTGLTVDGVTMSSHGANNDGCDPESCVGVHIKNCRFDTGDDCISLKSGRDRDGREANAPCADILIEHNDFADGHGGIALGSEMSGGIFRVLAEKNYFSSPNLTYALRMKTNAKRGGRIEDIILADSVMEHVHGAAVHGTMLYEDGRNGNDLPIFRNITVENIEAHGGDYGIFLEAFPEVPITGLVLRNIRIDGVSQCMRSMNWKDSVIEQVIINGKTFPRPGSVAVKGVPVAGEQIRAVAESCGTDLKCRFRWQISADNENWKEAGSGSLWTVPVDAAFVRTEAIDEQGNSEWSRSYHVLPSRDDSETGFIAQRLICRNMLLHDIILEENREITRRQLAQMLLPLANKALAGKEAADCQGDVAVAVTVGNGFLAVDEENRFRPEEPITREEFATVAMQACGVNYRNASSTMPVCADADQVKNNLGTNVARALYFGFMKLDAENRFHPEEKVTLREAMETLNKVADFAGI